MDTGTVRSAQMSRVQELRSWVEKKKGEKELLESQEKELDYKIKEGLVHISKLEKARWVIGEVARITQARFKAYVEPIITMALNAVYHEDNMKFLMDFSINRNQPECVLMVQEGEHEPYMPKDETGGGVVDILSFALRVVLWSLENPRTRAVFFLDEPMKNVGMGKDVLLTRAGEMMRNISDQLHFQLIIISHEAELSDITDKAWEFSKENGISVIRQIKGPIEKQLIKLRLRKEKGD